MEMEPDPFHDDVNAPFPASIMVLCQGEVGGAGADCQAQGRFQARLRQAHVASCMEGHGSQKFQSEEAYQALTDQKGTLGDAYKASSVWRKS